MLYSMDLQVLCYNYRTFGSSTFGPSYKNDGWAENSDKMDGTTHTLIELTCKNAVWNFDLNLKIL